MITDETRENGRQKIEYPVNKIKPHLATVPIKENWQQTLQKSAASEQYRQLSDWLVWHHRDWKSVYPNLKS